MSRKNKGKKARKRHYWKETKPHEINEVAKRMFGGKYYCIGDDLERKEAEALGQEDRVVQLPIDN